MLDLFATDPFSAARSFYGEAFDSILQYERKREECRRKAASLVPTLIDEFSHQTPRLDDVWPTTEALMR